MKATLVTVNGHEIKLTDDDFSRVSQRAKALGKSYTLQSGTIVNLEHFVHITPEVDQGEDNAEVVEQIPEATEEPEPEEDDGTPELTSAEIRKVKEVNELTMEQLAQSIGYSQASVRFAMKGDRISADFKKAFRAKYGVTEVDNADKEA